jgi:hypothetical protein
MDQQTAPNPDQTDDEILTYTVSDEALEAAAGTERGGQPTVLSTAAADPRPRRRTNRVTLLLGTIVAVAWIALAVSDLVTVAASSHWRLPPLECASNQLGRRLRGQAGICRSRRKKGQ